MICISTSYNLRKNVLQRAGRSVQEQFESRYRPANALLLDGGSTAAKRILFVPWQTDLQEIESTTARQVKETISWGCEKTGVVLTLVIDGSRSLVH